MWITLLAMAVAVSLEPYRIGMSVLMLNRPRPRLQLAAFLCGGLLMGMSVGIVVLVAVESRLPASTRLTLPNVQIIVGMLALAAAAFLALTTGHRTPPAWLTRILSGQSLWVAGAAGLGIGLPSVDYLAALAVIAAGGATPTTQMAALLMFNVVALAWVEIPLLAYLVAPQPTRAAMARLHRWIRTRARHKMAALLAAAGVVLLAAGLLGR